MSRWTLPNGDYCRDVCGQINTCKRLKDGKDPCDDACRYDKLRVFENAEEVLRKEGYL